ncbi:hypothetical protein ABEB36_010141 [Hypothenemus hampei]|uniref:Protein LLP homolog n=1 Tax=Hypothenemus hampei TaxID=57062 RepID=A0ABD1EIS9_HYPHA
MAKSIRSKWRRKCRAVKRVRYGEKELERLKKVLANDPVNKAKEVQELITNIEEIANVKSAEEIQGDQDKNNTVMDVDELKKEFNHKTLRDKNGAFPVWVHPRKIKATSKKNKKKKKKELKSNNKNKK